MWFNANGPGPRGQIDLPRGLLLGIFYPMKPSRVLCLLAFAISITADEPKLPRPDQVDKPENIKFIVPDKSKLAGTVIDDTEAKLVGEWKHSVHTPPFVGKSYIHDMKEKKGKKSATFTPNLPITSLYEVRVSHNSNIRRANGVPITINHAKGKSVVKIDEGKPAPIAKLFRSIGIFHFKKGREGSVTISTEGTEGKYVIVDSVQFLIVMP
jgi:hypothetical protein